MKFTLKGYWEPTPKGIRKLADSVLGAALLATTFSYIMDYHKVAIGIAITAIIAKFVSNFFADETTSNQQPQDV